MSRIDRSGAYKLKGYSSITEYARETLGMTPDGVSHLYMFMKSIPSGKQTPEEYRETKFSQLTEMLRLPKKRYC